MNYLNVTSSSKKLFQLQRKIQETEKKNPRLCRNFQRLLYRTSELQLLIIQKILQIQFQRSEKTSFHHWAKPQFDESDFFLFQETRTIQSGPAERQRGGLVFFSKLVSKEYRQFLKRQILNILWVFALSPIVENKKNDLIILTGLNSSQVYKTIGTLLQKPWIQYIIISQFSNFFNKKNKFWILSNLLIERKFFLHWLKSEAPNTVEPWRLKYVHHDKIKTLSLKITLENWIHFHFMNSYPSSVRKFKFDESAIKFSHRSYNDNKNSPLRGPKFPVLDKVWILNHQKILAPAPNLAAPFVYFQKLLLINGNLGSLSAASPPTRDVCRPIFYNFIDKTILSGVAPSVKNWGFAQTQGQLGQRPNFVASVSNFRYPHSRVHWVRSADPQPLFRFIKLGLRPKFSYKVIRTAKVQSSAAKLPTALCASHPRENSWINWKPPSSLPMLPLLNEKYLGASPVSTFKLTHDSYFRKFFFKRQKGHRRLSRNKVLGEAPVLNEYPRRNPFQSNCLRPIEYSGFLLLPLTTKKNFQYKFFHHYAKKHGLHLKFIKLYSLDQGIHFLGWFFKKTWPAFGGSTVTGAISYANIQNHQKELKLYLKTSANKPIDGIISKLNKKIFYWQKFYIGPSASEAARMNDYLFWLIWYWLKKRHRNRGSKWLYNRYWKKSIYRKWKFSDHNQTLISYNL